MSLASWPLRQLSAAHQIAVALARGFAAFVDGPDDQALAASAVAGGEHAGDARIIPAVIGFEVGARIGLDSELLGQNLLRTEEAEREEH